ncbi:MAG TPA: ABC transporter permease [Vicinamibacterales bacterium]|nr:ABC transporter permease [Vicinamibacterales bacterium]
MTTLARLQSWMRAIFRRSTVERQMHDELSFHIESYAADLLRAGVAPEEARRRARVEFGGVEARKDECRDALGLRVIDELVGDGRYAIRQLRHSPVFTAVAVLSLALGIGANSAIFSLMETALWKPTSVHDPERLQLFSWASGPRVLMNSSSGNWHRTTTGGRVSTSFSYPVFDALKRQTAIFDTVFGYKPLGRVTVMVDGEPELVQADLVSGEFFRGVGVAPVTGRTIEPGDDVRVGTEIVAVISHGYWARRFGSDPSAVGARIIVNQTPVTIVGVNAPGFTGVDPGNVPDVIMPLSAQPLVSPNRHAPGGSLLDDGDYWWVLVMGRLKADVTPTQAQGAMEVAFQQAVKTTLPDRPDRDRPQFRLLPGGRGQDNLREEFARPLFVIVALVGVVLLIACANVASLLLARAAARRREISLRLALGAGRWRITRQLLTEGLALGLSGGALGLVFAYWTRNAIPELLLPSWTSSDLQLTAAFDARVLLLTLAVTLATTVLSSLAPIWQSVRADVNAGLKDGGRAAMGAPAALRGKGLVVLQVCLSVSLLIGAGLFVRTLSNLRAITIGFQPEHVVLFTIDPPRSRYAGPARKALFERLDDAIGSIAGVEAASVSQWPLLSGINPRTRVGPNGRTPGPADEASFNNVGRRFFETMGIPILIGRPFDGTDRESSPPVAVVNERFVKEFFPDGDPIGRTIRSNDRLYAIIGVSGDTPYALRASVPPTFYRSFTQADEPGSMTFAVRTTASGSMVMNSVRAVVRGIDKTLPVFDVRTQTEQIDALLSRERLFVALTSAFGALALALASIGIYGVMAHGVSRRTSEIGLRIALGAERRDVLVMVLREASAIAAIGAAIGAATAVALSRSIRAMLFGITPTDPLTIGGAVVAMMVVALVAGWVPAWKASRLDPMTALRHE